MQVGRTNRRAFIAGLSGAAMWPVVVRGQQSAMPVVGVLSPKASTVPDVEGLRAGLRELGYAEGRNIRYEYRWANGNFNALSDLAAELVALKVNVIVTYVTQASLAAKKATSTIPIVMVGVADPIGVGLIGSLAHPGGNVTGTSSIAAALAAKQLELLKEAVPDASHIAALWNPANVPFQTLQVKQAEAAAQSLHIDLHLFEARAPLEFDPVFATIHRQDLRLLLILLDPLFINNFRPLVELSQKGRLITMTAYRTFVDAGGLMAYGPNYFNIYKLAAVYVDKILKGSSPADLPVDSQRNLSSSLT